MPEVYDKGHTTKGKDRGAISHTKQEEGKTNHNVVLKLAEIRKKAGAEVYVLNIEGLDYSINKRVNEAAKIHKKDSKKNITLSVHHNAGGGKGWEIFAEHNDPHSLKLAEFIGVELDKINEHRGVKTRVSTTDPTKNALGMLNVPRSVNVLIEAGFMDSEIEEFDTLAEQWREAEAIAEGVKNYMKWVG